MTQCPLCGSALNVDVDVHILYQYAIGSNAHAGAARRLLGDPEADRYSAIRRLESSAPFLARDARLWWETD